MHCRSLPRDRFHRAMRHHQAFQQRIAREAVRAMQSRATNFADRIQSRQTRYAVDVGLNSAALIMRRRHDWNRLFRHIDPEPQTGFVNMREAFLNELRRLMGDVEKYTWRAGAFDLGVD